ncbi:MAG: hypothetical protein ACYS0D_10490, partial [Planctomycetota bacterium]
MTRIKRKSSSWPGGRRYLARWAQRWPAVGLCLAVGLLVADALMVVGPYMAPFRTGAFWPVLATSLVGYGLSGAALDGLLSALGPAPLRRSPWARGLAILTIVASLVLLAGEARSLPLLCVAAAFAALALGRFAWPIAVIVAAIAFAPSVRSPASEGVQPDVASDAEAAAASGSPSCAVVVLDTLRWDHTSAY